jgi:hypothetical protein
MSAKSSAKIAHKDPIVMCIPTSRFERRTVTVTSS